MEWQNVMNKASTSPIPSAPAGVVWLEANGEVSKIKWEWFPAGVCESAPSPLVPALQTEYSFCHRQIISAFNSVSHFVKWA